MSGEQTDHDAYAMAQWEQDAPSRDQIVEAIRVLEHMIRAHEMQASEMWRTLHSLRKHAGLPDLRVAVET